MVKQLIFIFMFGFSLPALAGIDDFCFLLEGVPLPFCQYTRYHTCHSGARQQCMYAKTARTIKKIDDPATGTCAQNGMVCTTSRTCTPDGCTVSQNCTCKDPKPTVTQCRTVCDKCLVPGGQVDLRISCPHFCGDPDPCPSTWVNKSGEVLELVGPNIVNCAAPDLCADGGKPGDPTNVQRDCPIFPPPLPNTPKWDGCCYMGGSTEGNLYNLPDCPK